MEQNNLERLMGYFETHPDPVVIYDKDWKVLWMNRDSVLVEDLPEKLNLVSWDWNNRNFEIAVEGTRYECRLLCSKADQMRAVVFTPARMSKALSSLEFDHMNAGMQAIITNLYVISGIAEKDDAYDRYSDCLNKIEGACYKVYRAEYTRSQLEKMRANNAEKMDYCLNMILPRIYQNIRNVLDARVRLNYVDCDKNLFLRTNKDELAIAVLAGILLCYREDDFEHQLTLTLGEEKEGFAFIEIKVELLSANQVIDESQRGSLDDLSLERELMEVYRSKIGGQWMILENASARTVTGKLVFPVSRLDSCTEFRSEFEVQRRNFFSSYSQMLSKIHCRKDFV